MATSAWVHGFTDLAGNPIGEAFKPYERKLSLRHLGMSTAECKLKLEDPVAQELLDKKGDALHVVYQRLAGGSYACRYAGEVTGIQEMSTTDKGPMCAVVSAGPLWRLFKRFIGMSSAGVANSVIFQDVDRGSILEQLLTAENTKKATGIAFGTRDPMSPAYLTYTSKRVAEAFVEMAQTLSFPWETPSSWIISEDLYVAGGADLTSRAPWTPFPNSGGTDAIDFKGLAVPGVWRDVDDLSSRMDSWGTTDYDNILVETNVNFQAGPFVGWQGCFARGKSSGQVGIAALLRPEANSTLTVVQGVENVVDVGGPATWTRDLAAPVPLGPLTVNTGYVIRLQVDTAGRFVVWFFPNGQPHGAPRVVGEHSSLKAGATYATGRIGLADLDVTPWSERYVRREYAWFKAATPVYSADLQTLEWVFQPVRPTVANGAQIATLFIESRIGIDQPTVIFEWGQGLRTAQDYERAIDREGLANRAWHLPTDTGSAPLSAENAASLAARGLYEEMAQIDTSIELRQMYLNNVVNVRGVPKELITFIPGPGAPVYGVDYQIGDSVVGRARVAGKTRFNGYFRVHGVDITTDDQERDTVMPILTPP